MPKKKIYDFSISATSLVIFQTCPMQWAYKYLFKPIIVKVPQRHMVLGNALHTLMQHYYHRWEELEWKKTWLIDSWEDCYKHHFLKAKLPISNSEIISGKEHLDWLHGALEKQGWLKPAFQVKDKSGIEYSFKFPYNGHTDFIVDIIGKIDLLQKNSVIDVIDWKSGSNQGNIIDDVASSTQLLIYSAALKKVLDINEENLYLVYIYLHEIRKFTVGNELFKLIVQQVNALLDAYAVQEYQCIKGKHCQYCDYKIICKAETSQRI